MSGVWQEDRRFGLQVKVRVAESVAPSGEAALLAYLKRVKHIGAGRAARLLERYGDGVLEAIDFDPACVRTATTAVRRNHLDNVAILKLELRPDTVRLLPTTDCTLLLSVWHHLVRFQGMHVASDLLAEVWDRTGKVLFFDTGEDEMPA